MEELPSIEFDTPLVGRDLIGKLPTQELTPEQQLFRAIMLRLDFVKMSAPLESNNGIDCYKKNIRRRDVGGLSEESLEFLGTSEILSLFVEYGPDSRLLGLRNGRREIVFRLKKSDESCTSQTGVRVGKIGNRSWELEDAPDIPVSDAILLIEKGIGAVSSL